MASFLDKAGLTTVLAKLKTKFAPISHSHDDLYYTETEMDGKLAAKVPTSRKVNGKALSADITLTAGDVGASASGHNHDDSYYKKSDVDSKLSGKAAASHRHGADDITSVNASVINGVIAAANLPSFVDDVLEGYLSSDGKFYKSYDSTNKTYSNAYAGESGKIYVDLSNNKTYRWSGSAYVVVSETLALGETSSTAYRGDRGAAAYAHAVTNKGKALSAGLYKVTTNAEGHVTAGTAVQKSDITALGIPAQDTVYTHPTTAGNKHIPAGGASGQVLRWSADGTAVWGADNNTWIAFKGATTSAAGTAGYAPAPAAGAANRYLRSDGTWVVPPNDNTTYTDMKGASSSANGAHGLVPAPAKGNQGQFLRGDGTWATPTNTTYAALTDDEIDAAFTEVFGA